MFQIFSYLRYIKDKIMAFDFNDIIGAINLIEFNENFITPAYKFLIKGN